MPAWSTRIGIALFACVLLAFAWSPIVGVGPVGADPEILAGAAALDLAPARVAELDAVRELYALAGTDERPLAALSIVASDRLWREGPTWTAAGLRALRLESLGLLALGALLLGRFARRGLLPWTGRAPAQAAGLAIALLVVVHPLALPQVASLGGRGELLGLVLGSAAGWLFLRGRQERRYRSTAWAVVVAVLAGFASELALFVPPALAATELVSGRRHRPSHVRLRTAATTLVVFGVAVLFEGLVRGLVLDAPRSPRVLEAWRGVLAGGASPSALVAAFGEKLGLLLLPVDAREAGLFGFGLAGLCLLLALQPALVAARAAPRLWGWFHLGWGLSIVAACLPGALVRVSPEHLARADVLFAAVLAACTGLGVTATALSGARRVALPLAVAAGYAVLSFAAAQPWVRAAHAVDGLRRDVEAARAEHGHGAALFVVEPPREPRGLVAPAIAHLVGPLFTPGAAPVGPRPRGISAEALRVLVRTGALDRLRDTGVVWLLPAALVEAHRAGPAPALAPADPARGRAASGAAASDAAPSDAAATDAGPSDAAPTDAGPSDAAPTDAGPSDAAASDAGPSDGAASGSALAVAGPVRARVATRLPPLAPPGEPFGGPRLWREEGRSPVLDVDPLRARFLRVRAHPGVDRARPPVLEWRAKSPLCPQGRITGRWLDGVDGPEAWFDLERSLAWLAGQRIRRVWFPEGLDVLQSAELLEGAPALAEIPAPLSTEDGGWFFDPAPARSALGARLPAASPAGAGLGAAESSAGNGGHAEHARETPSWRLVLAGPDALEVGVLGGQELARAPGAERRAIFVPGVAAWLARAGRGREVAWALELCVGDEVLARGAGRR